MTRTETSTIELITTHPSRSPIGTVRSGYGEGVRTGRAVARHGLAGYRLPTQPGSLYRDAWRRGYDVGQTLTH